MRDHCHHDYFEKVKVVLTGHRGRENAITIDQLCAQVGCMKIDPGIHELVPDRRIMEDLLEHRNGDFTFIVAGSTKGIYAIERAAELNAHLDRCQGRAVKLFKRKRTDIEKALRLGFPRDGKHFMDPPAVPPPAPPVQAELSLSSFSSPSPLQTSTT